MTEFQESTWTEGRTEGGTDTILQDPSGYRREPKSCFLSVISISQSIGNKAER